MHSPLLRIGKDDREMKECVHLQIVKVFPLIVSLAWETDGESPPRLASFFASIWNLAFPESASRKPVLFPVPAFSLREVLTTGARYADDFSGLRNS